MENVRRAYAMGKHKNQRIKSRQGNNLVIDNTYCGDTDEWKFPAIAVRDTVIHANDRICQFRIEKVQPQIIFEEVDHLSADSRGGFGSTGVQ